LAQELFSRAAVIGLGLIGGSLGMALTQGQIAREVIGYDLRPEALELGLATRAITGRASSASAAAHGADLVILAVPVRKIAPLAREISSFIAPDALVTDVGSTKDSIVPALEEILGPAYVGGHPMAGSEQAGIEAADRYLLENVIYLVTPTTRTDPYRLARLEELILRIGARPVRLATSEHDQIVAVVSHLPHLLAAALVETAGQLPGALSFASGGFRDTTRVAAGSEKVWVDIFLSNRKAVLEAVGRLEHNLSGLKAALEAGDANEISRILGKARELRQSIPAKQKGLLPAIYDVVVTVPDRPGVIADLANTLALEGINIMDIEILRVREGDGGSIRLGFQSDDLRNRAVEVLRAGGVIAKARQ